MRHYNYHKKLQEIWTKAVDLYSQGFRDPDFFFNEVEISFLKSIGSHSKELFDYAEQFGRSGEPDFTTIALIQDIRRAYYLEVQGGLNEDKELETTTPLPPFPEGNHRPELGRISLKAKYKLTGRLGSEILYPSLCDREFLKRYDLHPAEFLRKVWESDCDLGLLANWIAGRERASDESKYGP